MALGFQHGETVIRLVFYILWFTIMCAAAIEGEWALAIVFAAVTYAMLPPKHVT